jgi:Ni,Fe-hydrogenase III small subunit
MRKLLIESLFLGPATEHAPSPRDSELEQVGEALQREARGRLGRSLSIREVDAGSCNACELEINALNNAYYDVERFGIRFVASPRHADVMLVTGPVTKNMREALERVHRAMPGPKWVVAVGECACTGGLFREGYACLGGVARVLPVDLKIDGCPPQPIDLLRGLLALLQKNAS